jgi:hypothetical protein
MIGEFARRNWPLMVLCNAAVSLAALATQAVVLVAVATIPARLPESPIPVAIMVEPGGSLPVRIAGGSVGVRGVVTLNEPIEIRGDVSASIVDWNTRDKVRVEVAPPIIRR